MFAKRVVTLNIEANSIRVLVLKGRKVEKWRSVPLEPGMVADGLILQPKAVGQAIDDLFKKQALPRGKVIAGLPGLHSSLRILTLPRMKSALLEEAVRRRAGKEIPIPLDEMDMAWQRIGDRDNAQDIFVLGVLRESVDAEFQTLAGAGIKPFIVELKPLALARAANSRDALIIDLEPDSFGIILVAGGIPRIIRTIAPRGGEATLPDNIRRLSDEIARTVEFYNRDHPEGTSFSPTAPAFLTGEMAESDIVIDLIRGEVEFPVEPLTTSLKYPPDFPAASYTVNIGLALRGTTAGMRGRKDSAGFHDIDLNILPRRYRARRLGMGYFFAFLIVMIAIAGLFPVYQAMSSAEAETARLQTEFDGIMRELRLVRLSMEEEKRIEDIITQTDALEQEHQGIIGRGGNLSATLQIIADALPSPVHLTSVVLTPEEITLNGMSDSPSGVIGYTRSLERGGAFTGVRIARLDETSFTIVIDNKPISPKIGGTQGG